MQGVQKRIDNKEFYKQLKNLAVPIALQTFMTAAISAGDSAMLGFVNQDSLAAVSLATRISFVLHLFTGSFAGGAGVICAQYWGKKDEKTIQKVFCLIVRYMVGVSGIFAFASFFCPEFLMRIFTSDAEMIRIGASYLKIAAPSFVFAGLSQCYLVLMQSMGRAKKSATISSSIVILDLILNAIFIFGLLGMPRMGADGAALTTVLSKGLELIIVVVDSFQKGNLRPSFKHVLSVSPEIEKEFWKYSFHILLDGMIWGIGITMYSVIIGHLGSDATAANSVASIVKDLLTCLCRGMSTGGGILIGNILGSGDLKLAKAYGDKLARLSIVCGVISGALVLLVAPPIFAFMQLTETARSYLSNMLLILAVYMFGKSVCVIVVTGIFNAGGDTKFDAYSVGVTMWGIIIPLAALSAFVWKLPVLVVYFIISMDEVIKLPWVYHHYKRYIWVKDITRNDL